jgi:hypothetical protein
MMSFPDFPLNPDRPDRVVIESPFNLRNESGDSIAGDLRYAEGGTGLPLLIICHGFTAHKDWGPFPYFGRRFAGLGFASAVFNFSHNGMGPGSRRFNELEKFSRNTIGKELEDIRALLRGAGEGSLGDGRIDPSRPLAGGRCCDTLRIERTVHQRCRGVVDRCHVSPLHTPSA